MGKGAGIVMGAVILIGSACGGQTVPDTTTAELSDAGLCEGTGASSNSRAAPAEHRAQPASCPAAQSFPVDAAVTCSADADCIAGYHCRAGQCGFDECIGDSDCASGGTCVCAGQAGGSYRSGNVCVPASCHVDTDCGAGQYCSPSRGYCGEVSGYFCTSVRDTCVEATKNCACESSSLTGTCVYAPEVGHWVCGTSFCAG
jgi:hypothetical protein